MQLLLLLEAGWKGFQEGVSFEENLVREEPFRPA
jgi:hypothetical protein